MKLRGAFALAVFSAVGAQVSTGRAHEIIIIKNSKKKHGGLLHLNNESCIYKLNTNQNAIHYK